MNNAVPVIPECGLIVAGVESSCDETGVGIVRLTRAADGYAVELLAHRLASSMDQHARYGGVVPEIASRAHLEAMVPTMRAALAAAEVQRPDVLGSTVGPGLAGALLVGASAAKAYAAAWEIPFYGVNHLVGHIAVDTLENGPLENAVVLLVSGGHTQLLRVTTLAEPVTELGSTLDDAAGEAYDKIARILGLGYPGGPVIDRAAREGNPRAIDFPRGLTRAHDPIYDFSFSGLKTAVARYVENAEKVGATVDVADLCASFQESVADVLTKKAIRACLDVGATTLAIGGGVAANSRLRELATARAAEHGIAVRVPSPGLCTDNGAMIAAATAHQVAAGAAPSGLTVGTFPSLDVSTALVTV